MNSTFTNPFIIALNAVIAQLTRLNVQYMVFGGVANSLFGDPRQTFDIDIKVVLESEFTTTLFRTGGVYGKTGLAEKDTGGAG